MWFEVLESEMKRPILSFRDFCKRGPNFNFYDMEIPNGAVLKFRGTSTTVQVVGPAEVRFRGERMSLTRATKIILGVDYAPATTTNWFYKGVCLRYIYNQTYR